MDKEKARKFIEEGMPQYKVVESAADDDSSKLASADAPDADVNDPSLSRWKKFDSQRRSAASDQIENLRSRFQARKLEGASSSGSQKAEADTTQNERLPEEQNLRAGKTGLMTVKLKNSPEDASGEEHDLVVDDDEGIIGASS